MIVNRTIVCGLLYYILLFIKAAKWLNDLI